MKKLIEIKLEPLGRTMSVRPGTRLHDVLFDYGVEFPCGGRGRCKGCKIKVIEGELVSDPQQQGLLSPSELANGWRLACKCIVQNPVTLQVRQWEATILGDETPFLFEPGEGLGIAVDLGTTTLVTQLVDLRVGKVLAVRSSLNPQARYGSDLMSRIQFAGTKNGQTVLQGLIRTEIGRMIEQLIDSHAHHPAIKEVTMVGNTAMHNVFCGIDVAPLAHYPFEPVESGLQEFTGGDLGWSVLQNVPVRFLPIMGSFVGSDILAGILATRLHESEALVGLVDLGTNGEIVFGNKERMICASAAAGPAFEGARIAMGMQAVTGAISAVVVKNGQLQCQVLGHTRARGICGSGLVDAIAAGLELGQIDTSGRIRDDSAVFEVCPEVTLSQRDVRELQLAKGAIAAGMAILLKQLQVRIEDVQKLYLAGAFGNYINPESAQRIGLLRFPLSKIIPVGNSALRGARLALFRTGARKDDYSEILTKVTHVSLNTDPDFQNVFAEEMLFAGAGRE